jgi:hypothetical protein
MARTASTPSSLPRVIILSTHSNGGSGITIPTASRMENSERRDLILSSTPEAPALFPATSSIFEPSGINPGRLSIHLFPKIIFPGYCKLKFIIIFFLFFILNLLNAHKI